MWWPPNGPLSSIKIIKMNFEKDIKVDVKIGLVLELGYILNRFKNE